MVSRLSCPRFWDLLFLCGRLTKSLPCRHRAVLGAVQAIVRQHTLLIPLTRRISESSFLLLSQKRRPICLQGKDRAGERRIFPPPELYAARQGAPRPRQAEPEPAPPNTQIRRIGTRRKQKAIDARREVRVAARIMLAAAQDALFHSEMSSSDSSFSPLGPENANETRRHKAHSTVDSKCLATFLFRLNNDFIHI